MNRAMKYGILSVVLGIAGFAAVSQTIACWRRHCCCPVCYVPPVCCVYECPPDCQAVYPPTYAPADSAVYPPSVMPPAGEPAPKGEQNEAKPGLPNPNATTPFTAEGNLQKMKDAGISDEIIKDYASKGKGHEDVDEIIRLNKVAPFTEEDIKQLKDAGAKDEDIEKWKKDRRGHDDVPEILKKLKMGEVNLRPKIIPALRDRLVIVRQPSPATIVVKLPAEARLTIDSATDHVHERRAHLHFAAAGARPDLLLRVRRRARGRRLPGNHPRAGRGSRRPRDAGHARLQEGIRGPEVVGIVSGQ